VEGGWQPFPGARDGEAAFRLPPVEPGRVIGLGAVCDLRTPHADPRESFSFKVSEFVTLEDGRRVLLHDGGGRSAVHANPAGERAAGRSGETAAFVPRQRGPAGTAPHSGHRSGVARRS